jgi:Mrp family chromosome partitioning ATPase
LPPLLKTMPLKGFAQVSMADAGISVVTSPHPLRAAVMRRACERHASNSLGERIGSLQL